MKEVKLSKFEIYWWDKLNNFYYYSNILSQNARRDLRDCTKQEQDIKKLTNAI